MRERPERIVEELRLSAEMDAVELGEPIAEFLQTDAADYIVHLRTALGSIAAGASEPAAVATEALDDDRWMRSGSPKPDLP